MHISPRTFSITTLLLITSFAYVVGITNNRPPTPTRPTDLGGNLITRHTYPSTSYGIQAFLWWDSYTRQRDLELVRQLRFGYVKQTFYWNDIQPDPKLPDDWSHADALMAEVQYRGLKLIARLSRAPDWATVKPSDPTQPPYNIEALTTYCGDLAARYKGRIAGYEIWNEPNLLGEWGNYPPNAAAYVALLKACSGAIHKADPNAVIISAGLAPTGGDGNPDHAIPDDTYLQAMYTAGAAPYYDVLGLNAPGYKSPPETPPDDPSLEGSRWQAFRHVEDMRAIMVANGEGAKQIAIMEMGWTLDSRPHSPYAWFAVTERQQSNYLVGAYRYAAAHWQPWVGLIVTIYLPDPSWTPNNEEYWWSIMTPGENSYHLREAYEALANMDRHTEGVDTPIQPPGAPQYTPMPPRPTDSPTP